MKYAKYILIGTLATIEKEIELINSDYEVIKINKNEIKEVLENLELKKQEINNALKLF